MSSLAAANAAACAASGWAPGTPPRAACDNASNPAADEEVGRCGGGGWMLGGCGIPGMGGVG